MARIDQSQSQASKRLYSREQSAGRQDPAGDAVELEEPDCYPQGSEDEARAEDDRVDEILGRGCGGAGRGVFRALHWMSPWAIM